MTDKTDKPNLRSIPTRDQSDEADHKQVIDTYSRYMPHLIEEMKVFARVRKANYDAHVAAGFSKHQALMLCNKISRDG